MDNNKQKEDFIRRLAQKEPEEDKKGNVIRARAFYINLNAPQTGYEYKRTRIASK